MRSYKFYSPSLAGNQWDGGGNFMDVDVATSTVSALGFSGNTFSKLFESTDILYEDFAQQFMRNFGIPKLDNLYTLNKSFVKYGVTDGDLKIFLGHAIDNKTKIFIALEQIPKASF